MLQLVSHLSANGHIFYQMPPKKNLKVFDDQAQCSAGESSDESSDEDDSDMDSFLVSDGELSDSHFINRNKSSKPAAAPVVAAPKKRGRPPGKTTAKTKAETYKSPGDTSYPLSDFSLTVTKTGGDVGLDALESMALFIETHCVKGGVATEVGQRAFNFHLQGMFRIHWPARKEYIQELQKIIKRALPDGGKKFKVNLKPFGVNQTFSAMVGYITKDQGNKLFLLRVYNYR